MGKDRNLVRVMAFFIMLVSGTLTGVRLLVALMNWIAPQAAEVPVWRDSAGMIAGPALVSVLTVWVANRTGGPRNPKGHPDRRLSDHR